MCLKVAWPERVRQCLAIFSRTGPLWTGTGAMQVQWSSRAARPRGLRPGRRHVQRQRQNSGGTERKRKRERERERKRERERARERHSRKETEKERKPKGRNETKQHRKQATKRKKQKINSWISVRCRHTETFCVVDVADRHDRAWFRLAASCGRRWSGAWNVATSEVEAETEQQRHCG